MTTESPADGHARLRRYAPPDAPPNEAPGGTPNGSPEAPPSGTTPTYELEMLISGTVTFGLLQLPSLLDAAYDAGRARVAESLQIFVVLGWLLGKAALVALIGSFLLHLATRAYWVGLVGLDSVFPRGTRWDRLTTAGHVTRDEYARRIPPLRRTIARLDNVASTIFALAFLEVLFVVAIGVVLFGLGALLELLSRAPRGSTASQALGWLLVAILAFLVLTPLTWAVDKAFGRRLRRGSLVDRALRLAARAKFRVFGVWLYGPIMYTLMTNVRKRIVLPVVYAGMAGSLALAWVTGRAHSRGAVDVGAWLPAREDLRTVYAGDYEALRRGTDGAARTPSIQSEVVDGPYVRLFVPYAPERDAWAVRHECPGAARLPRAQRAAAFSVADSAAYDRAFDCLARVRRVSLDGRPVADLRYLFQVHPTTGVPGLIAFIPTDGLGKGMHTLFVRSAPDSIPKRGARSAGSTIVFWR